RWSWGPVEKFWMSINVPPTTGSPAGGASPPDGEAWLSSPPPQAASTSVSASAAAETAWALPGRRVIEAPSSGPERFARQGEAVDQGPEQLTNRQRQTVKGMRAGT